MNNNFKFKRLIYKYSVLMLVSLFVISISFVSCEKYELPEANSIEDVTPPSANFSYSVIPGDFKSIQFTNLSGSANDFSWDFGDGNTSTDQDPINTFADGEGIYQVSLRAADGNGVEDNITIDVEVLDLLIPAFLCPSFECDDRSVWGGGNASSPYSGSGAPTPPDGTTGAKIGANSTSQFLDQTILVSPSTTYQISFSYVSKSGGSSAGELLIEDADDNTVFIQESVPLSPDADNYVGVTPYTFETTATTENLRFYMTAGDVEVRFDLVEITKI